MLTYIRHFIMNIIIKLAAKGSQTVLKRLFNHYYYNGIGIIERKTMMTSTVKPKVYVTRKIDNEALNLLKENFEISIWESESDPVPRDVLIENINDKTGLFCLITEKIDEELLQNAPKLKVIATMSVGFDHLDVKAIKQKNIRIGHTPGVLTDCTAELAVALLLATSRRVVESNYQAKTGGWKSWSPYWMCGPGLKDSTVGIVGFGRIGIEVARRLKPFKVKSFLYNNPSEKKEAKEFNAEKVKFDNLLEQSDFVIVTCSLTSETQNLFNDCAFKRMKKSAVFINISRGGVVCQSALLEALKNREIWAAGLDVTTPEPLPTNDQLFKLNNCIILPHIGTACIVTRKKMAQMTAENLIKGIKGEEMPAELKL